MPAGAQHVWARSPGQGTMDSNYRVRNCASCASPDYIWHEQTVRRIDATTITQQRTKAQNEGRNLASKINAQHIGKFIAVQNRGDDTDPNHFWIGRLVDAGKGHPVKTFPRGVQFNGMRFKHNEHAVAVEWYECDASDDENRTFYPGCAGVDYFNSSELRVLDIGMVQTVKVRSSRSVQTTEQRQRERWVLKEADETCAGDWPAARERAQFRE